MIKIICIERHTITFLDDRLRIHRRNGPAVITRNDRRIWKSDLGVAWYLHGIHYCGDCTTFSGFCTHGVNKLERIYGIHPGIWYKK